jgi:hypothetical protein
MSTVYVIYHEGGVWEELDCSPYAIKKAYLSSGYFGEIRDRQGKVHRIAALHQKGKQVYDFILKRYGYYPWRDYVDPT